MFPEQALIKGVVPDALRCVQALPGTISDSQGQVTLPARIAQPLGIVSSSGNTSVLLWVVGTVAREQSSFPLRVP